jgi:hypothetical protein
MKQGFTFLTPIAAVIASASFAGCATSQEAGRAAVSTPVALDEVRCRTFQGDDAIKAIVSGDAVESVAPLYGGTMGKTSFTQL